MLNENSVKQQITYLLIPFAFKEDLTKTLKLVNLDVFRQEQDDNAQTHFFDYIKCLVKNEGEIGESIGKKFILDQGGRKRVGLPPNLNTGLSLVVDGEPLAQISITEVSLYLFESQVGFLIFKVFFNGEFNFDQVIQANYYMKKFVQKDIVLSYRIGRLVTDVQEVQLGEVIHTLTESLNVKTFFEGENQKPKQALVYSTTLLKGTISDQKQLNTYLFRARRAFKHSYLPSDSELEASYSAEVLPLFRNSHWGISLEGLANIIETVGVGTEVSETNAFFGGNYSYHIEKAYLYMYILALHQRFGLLHLSIEASEFSKKFDDYIKNPTIQIKDVIHMNLKLVRFKLRSTFTQISNVTHQDKLYANMRKVLKIEELLSELHAEMESLSALMQIAELRENRENDQKKVEQSEKFQRALGVVSFIFLPFGALTGFFGMNFKFTSTENLPNLYFLLSILLIYMVAFFVYWLWIHPKKE
ncbi:CorA family divalent cation transporter [Paenibacillus sp. N3.4]|uniref:CorA family divalent cation transporter n=1 Tax=Paenibacillus sp. N3.4 TaxID=2603222 RepID=UPI0011C9A3B6|nr:CorA family divalent cation transporter [Paenibacillus sp. N3.4]TXK82582.1 hypothetical protein FU659_14705 [Paenibacillus sp. N3.4]